MGLNIEVYFELSKFLSKKINYIFKHADKETPAYKLIQAGGQYVIN